MMALLDEDRATLEQIVALLEGLFRENVMVPELRVRDNRRMRVSCTLHSGTPTLLETTGKEVCMWLCRNRGFRPQYNPVDTVAWEQEDAAATVAVIKKYDPLHMPEKALAPSPLSATQTTLRELTLEVASLKQQVSMLQ